MNSEELSTGYSQPSSSASPDGSTNSVSFTSEKEDLFQHRFEEGYDLLDPEYLSWLRLNHPDAVPSDESSVSDFFSDIPALSPIDVPTI